MAGGTGGSYSVDEVPAEVEVSNDAAFQQMESDQSNEEPLLKWPHTRRSLD